MGYKTIHIATCDCCGSSWKSGELFKVSRMLSHYEFNTHSGKQSLSLCKECGERAKEAVGEVYVKVADGLCNISVRGYYDYSRDTFTETIDLDEVNDNE